MNPNADDVLALLRRWNTPVPTRDLARELDVAKGERVEFRAFLKTLERRGLIERVHGRAWQAARSKPETQRLTGTLSVNRRGTGFVRLDAECSERVEGHRDIFVSELDLADALDGDRVVVALSGISHRGARGRIAEVLERAHARFVGQYQLTGRGRGQVTPRNASIHRIVRVPEPDAELGVRNLDWVVVELTRYPAVPEPLAGTVIERLGASHDQGIDVLLLLRDRGIVEEFPVAAERAAAALNVDWKAELAWRKDLRDLVTATIDPITAKDFDDALSIEPLGARGWRLWVHIADVSHFVRPGEPLDNVARERSTSVYPVDRVVPMLPERLSNDLCSLRPNEDRLAMTAELLVGPDGLVREASFHSTVIRSNQRLAYEQAQAFFEEAPGGAEAIVPEVRDALLHLRDCARALRKARFARGALDLDIPELEIVFHEDGQVSHMRLRERFEAHMLVEDCMLAANEAVARHLKSHRAPTLYRVHETAEAERLDRLIPMFQALDIPLRLGKGGVLRPQDLQGAIAALEKRRGGHILRRYVLRAMQRARYAVQNLGHFGLASECYCHFTSPIRRYPDIVVHRQTRALERGEPLVWPANDEGIEQLTALAEHTSFRERGAEDAERESETIKAIEFLAQHVGETFEGLISGVQPFGLFVELQPHGIDGLVPIRAMSDDRYEMDDFGIELVGQRTGRRLRLTDRVRVRLVRANPFEMDLDLELVEGGGRGRPGRRPGKSQPFYRPFKGGKGSSGKKRGR
jgi:ribonuclease R